MSCKLLCLLLVATIGYVSARSPSELLGAQDAEPNEFPYVVSIQIQNEHFCGGSIISEYHILTAAHCVQAVQFLPISDLTVVTGTNEWTKGGQFHKVAGVYVHPEYRGRTGQNWYNDVAVIKLEKAIFFNKAQNKIDLPTSPPPVNVNAEVCGWGYDTFPPRALSDTLQKLSLKVISLEECREHHDDTSIQPNMICTLSERGVGTCSGDSGGPLVYLDKIIGIVSGGIPCAHGIPDIFTNVYVVLPFIQEAMKL